MPRRVSVEPRNTSCLTVSLKQSRMPPRTCIDQPHEVAESVRSVVVLLVHRPGDIIISILQAAESTRVIYSAIFDVTPAIVADLVKISLAISSMTLNNIVSEFDRRFVGTFLC